MNETPECKSPLERDSDDFHAGALPQFNDSLMNAAKRSTQDISNASITPIFFLIPGPKQIDPQEAAMNETPALNTAATFTPARQLPFTTSTLQALAICKQARETFNALLREAPDPGQVIRSVLRDTFEIDPDTSGLDFASEGQYEFASLTQLAVYARNHGAASDESSINAQPRNLPARLGLISHSASHLIARLSELDLPEAIRQQWATYWQTRAQGTWLSRDHHGRAQYVSYFEAEVALASAANELTEHQFRPVTGALKDPEWKRLDGKQILIEAPTNALGALVFSIEGEDEQVLYLPDRAVPFSSHVTRAQMERHLPAAGDSDTRYRSVDDVAHAHSLLLEDLLDNTLKTLDHDPGDIPREHAPLALVQIEALAQERRNPQLFFFDAASSGVEAPADTTLSLTDFGGLGSELSAYAKSRLIDTQMELISRLDPADVKKLEDLQQLMGDLQDDAWQAITDLLITPDWHSATSPIHPSDTLVACHHDGLKTHARIQQLLGQITEEQLRNVEYMLDQGTAFLSTDTAVAAARPLIKSEDGTQNTFLHYAVVISDPATLAGTADGPLLLYWLGEHGGLLNCPNLKALEDCLDVQPGHNSLELSRISADVIGKGLRYPLSMAHQRAMNDADETELPHIRETLETRLQVPRHAARDMAMTLVRQQDDVVKLATASANQIKYLPLATRKALSQLVPEYMGATRRSQALLNSDLQAPLTFSRLRINERLKADFPEYDGSYIGIDLPRSVDLVTDIVSQGGTPGTVTKREYRPSAQREQLSLETLMLDNIDEDMGRRLNHLKLALATTDPSLTQVLRAGIDGKYLKAVTADLDLAQAYEDQILATYLGINDAPFVAQFRQECLLAPFELMLRMHGLMLHGQGRLDAQALAILEIAIKASSHAAYRAGPHDIKLRAAVLTSGGPDTDSAPSTLSGITFIEDGVSRITLLYLPEHDSQPLRQFENLEAARLSLYELCTEERGVEYLASRALVGDPLAHRARLRQAHSANYSSVIGIGVRWPATTSLASHLLKAQMGVLIEAHRSTSRSNAELWMDNFAYQSTMVFAYLKITLSLLPFVGTVIGLYDLFDSAHRAANAFIDGKVIEGLEALNDVLLSLIDGATDLVTGVGINLTAVRTLTRKRQLSALRSGTSAALRGAASTEQRLARFAGYEYEHPLTLQGLSAGTQGRYRGVYQHSAGDFIDIDGHYYQVAWDTTAHTWRLKGTISKGWKRAIGLDEYGRWDTHFALYGVHLQGGGSGGGQVLQGLAAQLDPYWPAAIRDQLPRFLVDQHYHRQRRLELQAFTDDASLVASINRSNALAEPSATALEREAAFKADITVAERTYQSWDDLSRARPRGEQQTPTTQKRNIANLIYMRLRSLISLRAERSIDRLRELAALRAQILGVGDFTEQLPLLREWRKKAIAQLQDRDLMYKERVELDPWFRRAGPDAEMSASHTQLQRSLNPELRAFFDTLNLMPAALRYNNASVVAEFLLEQLSEFEEQIHTTRNTLLHLHEVQTNVQQRRQVYEGARTVYSNYKRRLQSTYASLAALFDDAYLKRLHENLDTLIAMSDAKLRQLPTQQLGAKAPNASPRLFLDTDGHWQVGDYSPAAKGQPEQMVINGDDGKAVNRFTADGERWRKQPKVRAARNNELTGLRQAANQALAELPDYRNRVAAYQRQGMLPVDVEHMMVIKAEDLEGYADRLQRLDGAAPEPARLRQEAQAMRSEGRTLRIDQVKHSIEPNEGQLNYLLQEQQVELRRVGSRQMLKENDYLQEYEVLNGTGPDAPVLWYAHFHYRALETPFERFSAAHLKRVEDRYHGPQWQQAQAQNSTIWRGPISTRTAQHFVDL